VFWRYRAETAIFFELFGVDLGQLDSCQLAAIAEEAALVLANRDELNGSAIALLARELRSSLEK
jgi:hypothetical protein